MRSDTPYTSEKTALPFPFKWERRAVWCLLLLYALLSACGRGPQNNVQVAAFSGTVMGTDYHVTLLLPRPDFDHQAAAQAVENALNRIDRLMSTYKPDSEISRFNASRSSEPYTVSPDTAEVIRIALQVSEMSSGAFDITVGPLVRAWGFGPDPWKGPPSRDEIARILERVGWQHLKLNGQQLAKEHPELECDLSAIAKGYAVDQAAAALDALGVEHYLVEVGGEARTRGHNRNGRPWRIGIEAPVPGERKIQAVALLSGKSIASSGNYRNFHEADAKRLGHTINPKTGEPVQGGPDAVSVIHESCAWADALATALMAMPAEAAWQKAQEWQLAACVMTVNPQNQQVILRSTTAMENLLDPAFQPETSR